MQPQGIYKGYKVSRTVLIGIQYEMQYEIVFKSDRLFMLHLPSSKVLLLLKLLRRWLLALVLMLLR